jgi:hypothetical protein
VFLLFSLKDAAGTDRLCAHRASDVRTRHVFVDYMTFASTRSSVGKTLGSVRYVARSGLAGTSLEKERRREWRVRQVGKAEGGPHEFDDFMIYEDLS